MIGHLSVEHGFVLRFRRALLDDLKELENGHL